MADQPVPGDHVPIFRAVVQPGAAGRPTGPDAAAVLRAYGVTLPPDCPPHVAEEVARLVSFVWVDGRVVRRDQFHIDPLDEGLLFGRGLWECTRTFDGAPWLWPLHLDRLRRTAELLQVPLPPAGLPDGPQVAAFVRSLTATDVVVRLNVSAGSAARPGVVWMTAGLMPPPPAPFRLQSRRVSALKDQPYLTWKTFQYGGRLLAGRQAHEAGFDTALLLDENDFVLEAAHANIFIRLPTGWVTPPAGAGLLPGTVRQHILKHAPVPVREEAVAAAQVGEAQEVFLTNSNVGLVPVVQIDQRTFPVGPETQQLQRWVLPVKPAPRSPAAGPAP